MKIPANSLIAAFLLFSLLQACNSIAETPSQTSANGSTLSGHYIYGHEANSFQPCGKKEVYWVEGSDELLDRMAERYSKLTITPYEEVFATIVGKHLGKATDGFAMDYDGQIQVIELVLMRKRSDADCR